MKTKGINFEPLKISEAGQVEEFLGQVPHEVYLADGQVDIVTFFWSCKRTTVKWFIKIHFLPEKFKRFGSYIGQS